MATTYPYNPYRQQAKVGVSFQPTYDPSHDQQIGALIQQEGQKAQAAMAGIQSQEAATGDIFSYDIEGREKRLSEFRSKTGEIKEKFGNDLAQAAPALAQAVVAERSNPWYQKNKLYTKEYERRQKLQDQFGPNLITMKDLPQGDLAGVDMDDIKYEAINRQNLYQIWNEELGDLGDKISDLGLSTDPKFAGMLKHWQLKGLTENQRLELVKSYGPMIDQMLEERGWPNTPENRDMLAAEFDQWSKQLIGGESSRYMQDPAYDDSGSGSFGGFGQIPTRDFSVSTSDVEIINFNPEQAEALKQSRAWKTGEPMAGS